MHLSKVAKPFVVQASIKPKKGDCEKKNEHSPIILVYIIKEKDWEKGQKS